MRDTENHFSVVVATTTEETAEVAAVLKTFGYEMRLAGSVQEVYTLLRTVQNVTAIVTDVALRDGNWRDVIERVRATGSHSPIVLCARFRTAELWWDALEAGVSEVIAAPRAVSELRAFFRGVTK